MRILGIDPGSVKMGIGTIDFTRNKITLVSHHILQLKEKDLPTRLGKIYEFTEKVIRQYNPDSVAIESVFMAKNPQSALTLGHARGSAICAAIRLQKSIHEYSALQIKSAVVGVGRADKRQVKHMVKMILGLKTDFSNDEADALACAICHAHTRPVRSNQFENIL